MSIIFVIRNRNFFQIQNPSTGGPYVIRMFACLFDPNEVMRLLFKDGKCMDFDSKEDDLVSNERWVFNVDYC